jgi:hypothetical protein
MVHAMDPQQPMDRCSTTNMLVNGTNRWLGLLRGFMVCSTFLCMKKPLLHMERRSQLICLFVCDNIGGL